MAPATKEEDAGSKFNPTGYNDLGFAFAFIAQLAAVIGWVCFAASSGKYHAVEGAASSGKTVVLLENIRHGAPTSPNPADSMHYFIILIFLSLAIATFFAALWMALLKSFPVEMVKGSLFMLPCASGILTVYTLATGGQFIMMAIMTALSALFVWWSWDRVDFTARIVKATITIYDKASLIYAIGFGVIMLQVAWMTILILAVIPLVGEGGGNAGVFVLLLLSMYWGMHVISNILYVSAAGVVARHYFGEQKEEATKKAFGQACTNYFGSICLGSLLIAIVQTLRDLVKKAAEHNDGNAAAAAIACVADCLLGCLESLVQIFNEFAFCYIAIYGIGFFDAAKKTYNLLTSSDALIKDTITNIVTLFGCLGVAIACAGFNCLAAWRLQLSKQYAGGAAFAGFVVGFAIMSVVSRIVEGGCTTLVICFEEEPDKLDQELKIVFNERKRLKN